MKHLVATLAFVLVLVAGGRVRAADYIVPESGDAYFRHELHNIHWLRFAIGGRRIVSGSFKEVRLWDVAGRRSIAERKFATEPRLVRGDERTLIVYEKAAGFLEFDPTTLAPLKQDAPTAASKFLAAIHSAHPPESTREFEGSSYTLVKEYWRSRKDAAACSYVGGFCFAPQADQSTWIDIECDTAAFAPDALMVVYSDDSYELRRDGDATRHIICERFQPNGLRAELFRFPYPVGFDLGGLLIADDGSSIVCSWYSIQQRIGVRKPERIYVEAYNGESGKPIGRLELPQHPDRLLLGLQLDRSGKKLCLTTNDGNTIYDLGPTDFVERSRLAMQLPYYGFRIVADDALERFATFEHGRGFAIVDRADPTAHLDSTVHWTPWGLLGDDAIVLRSTLGYKCARLSAAAAEPPKFRLPATDMLGFAEDRSCVLAVSAAGDATLFRRDDVPLRKQPLTDAKVHHVAVSGGGRRCAYATADDMVFLLERKDTGNYAELHSFPAGGRVHSVRLSVDGRSLLTVVAGPKHSRVAVYREMGSTWKIRCAPFDRVDMGAASGFAGSDLVFATKYVSPIDTRAAKTDLEVRRISDDKVVDTSSVDYVGGVFIRQRGTDTIVPLVRDKRLLFRDLTSHRETTTDAVFDDFERPGLVFRDLGIAVFNRHDGRVAVRRFALK